MSDIFYQNLEVKATKLGKGLFSKVFFPKDTILLEFKGDLISRKQIKNYGEVLQINEDVFLGLSGEMDDYINHSCDPNCGLKITGNRALLISLYEIQPGMEITFDYSTSSTDSKEEWEMDCKCQLVLCRKKISGYQFLPENIKKFYKDKKVVPNYLIGK